MGVPLRVFYRNTSSSSATSSIAADTRAQRFTDGLQFAISEQPLTSAQRSNFSSTGVTGDSLHIPLFINSYGLFYNIPGNQATSLNMTACLAARILKGAASVSKITILVESATSGATSAVLGWLATACPSLPVTYDSIRTDVVLVGADMIHKLLSTPFSFGWMPASAGRAASLPEFALETSTPGQFVVCGASNTTALWDALVAVVPTTLTGDYSSVSVSALPASGVAPILTLTYLITRSNWSYSPAEAQRGEAVKALAIFFHTVAVTGATGAGSSSSSSSSSGGGEGMLSQFGLLSLGSTVTAAIRAASSGAFITGRGAVPYVFADSNGPNEMRARSTSPMHLVYRATGSGSGQNEVVAKANGYQAIVDFGISDTPMPDALYTDLTANGKVAMVHIPVLLAPMNFFVNIPESVLPSRQLRLSPCTLAKIMQHQADILSWSHTDIAADNNGFTLPDQLITVFYRQFSSGTTAVITAYLTATCPTWRLGSGSLLSIWPATFKPAANALNMSTSVFSTPWSIGYMDAANGLDLNLVEVAIQNKEGNFVTTQTGDVPGAASALFKSDAWPKDPLQSFSAVSVLNQPGATTFPIVAMPFMFVRTDLTNRGDAGALLQSFLTFLLGDWAQHVIAPAAGFSPLPAEVRQYTTERALPLLQIDTRAKMWTFESGSVLPAGKGSADYVISSFAGSFENTNAAAFADFYKAYYLLQNKATARAANASATSATSINASALLSYIPANLKDQLQRMDRQIAVLQIIAITGICFGILGLILAIFSSCRIFVHSTLWGGIVGGSAGVVHPTSMINMGGGSVRKQKSSGNMSETSLHDMAMAAEI
ncbi:hypothetical protein VOLCADRAFT_99334 [Volvox carteri f. nagariensis]|uniref:PBP domain-containing protein n=1 Tax=Volvox carteri f. nagariensis TaxID=3068 RepID=D8UHJ6_VOLCA|nr:uncharacterized protein VOLCADRAFT_99334 [Volvox carteri f. nagariensis]EFJ40785.1 hypothetical protein VOLCADRAFT_99334 [Volvox carteri f. nagariensis]|eukprot:XP_002958160.1 hypothetical protein VOLCADRAFT_99334 [Volvox carteri f. nagariensis]